MIKLENWSLVLGQGGSAFDPPELLPRCLQGNVYGHPKHMDGKFVITSRIVKTNGRQVDTYSGSIYWLENPDPKYLSWLEDNDYDFNSEEPIKIIKK